MTTTEIVAAIATTLGTGEDAILFRRGVRRHLSDLTILRARGLTWDQIARKLSALGVRHKRGQTVSPHQLRTEYARLHVEATPRRLDNPVREHFEPALHSVPMPMPAAASIEPGGVFQKLAALTETRVRHLEVDE